jgi:gentisate 1,2-dioxygenase
MDADAHLMPDDTARRTALAWRWQAVRLCARAGELVPIGAARAACLVVEPGARRSAVATRRSGALQHLGAGESAPAHRHTPGAIRFVIEGEGALTTVDGDACDMTPGDLVLTRAGAGTITRTAPTAR